MDIETTHRIAVLRVADDGPGLPGVVRDRLFRRAHSGTGGTGYGLSIARELAERNGGSLRLAAATAGTSFVIELPRAVPDAAPSRAATAPAMQPHFA